MFHHHGAKVIFEVTMPATDLTLLTAQELRAAVGLAIDDGSQDAALAALGLQCASEIAAAAKVSKDNLGGYPITLRKESCRATFYFTQPIDGLYLPRRFVTGVTSIVENDTTLDGTTDYLIEGNAGLVTRMRSDWPVWWCRGKTVVEFDCGFDEIEDDLRSGAIELVQIRNSEGGRDPLVKSIRTSVPELDDRQVDYWVGSVPGSAEAGGSLPESVAMKLSRYIIPTIG